MLSAAKSSSYLSVVNGEIYRNSTCIPTSVFVKGLPQTLPLDDFFPFEEFFNKAPYDSTFRLFFNHLKGPASYSIALMQKAWAKSHVTYLRSIRYANPAEVFSFFTGAPAKTIDLKSKNDPFFKINITADSIFDLLSNSSALKTASTKMLLPKDTPILRPSYTYMLLNTTT